MRAPAKGQGNKIDPAKTDITAGLSDALLQRVLLALPEAARVPCGLVCHRWLRIVGSLHRHLRLLDWRFLESGRLATRFPHLTDLDLTLACMRDPQKKGSVLLSMPSLFLPLPPLVPTEDKPFSLEACIRSSQLTADALDRGLAALASGCPDLQRLRLVDVSNNHGPGGSFSEWEFVSANEKPSVKLEGVRNGEKVASGEAKAADEKPPLNLEEVSRNGEQVVDEKPARKLEETFGNGEKLSRDGEMAVGGGVKDGEGQGEGFRKGVEGNAEAGGDGEGEGKNVGGDGAMALRASESDSDGELGRKAGGAGKGAVAGKGLGNLARGCTLLQELEIHQCTDETVNAVVACKNVQILRLVGTVPGFSTCSFTDVGLTILANRCRRLLRLELSGCEASFAGIAAIGQCCLMLEELTLSSTGFQEGWVAALGYFGFLHTLRLENCRYIDRKPGPVEHLQRGSFLERLQLVCCDLRDRGGFAGLLTVCANVRELEFQDCWGLDDETFALAATCRKVELLSLDGCSLITAAGLETVALACKELQRLRVVYCSSIRDSEISPDFGDVVVMLKEFRWRPDTKSLLSSTSAIAQTGRWFFNKA